MRAPHLLPQVCLLMLWLPEGQQRPQGRPKGAAVQGGGPGKWSAAGGAGGSLWWAPGGNPGRRRACAPPSDSSAARCAAAEARAVLLTPSPRARGTERCYSNRPACLLATAVCNVPSSARTARHSLIALAGACRPRHPGRLGRPRRLAVSLASHRCPSAAPSTPNGFLGSRLPCSEYVCQACRSQSHPVCRAAEAEALRLLPYQQRFSQC